MDVTGILAEIAEARKNLQGDGSDPTTYVPLLQNAKDVREYFILTAAFAIKQIEVIDAQTQTNAKRGSSLQIG